MRQPHAEAGAGAVPLPASSLSALSFSSAQAAQRLRSVRTARLPARRYGASAPAALRCGGRRARADDRTPRP